MKQFADPKDSVEQAVQLRKGRLLKREQQLHKEHEQLDIERDLVKLKKTQYTQNEMKFKKIQNHKYD